MPNGRALRGSVPLPMQVGLRPLARPHRRLPGAGGNSDASSCHGATFRARAGAGGTARPREAQAGPQGRAGRARRERTGRRGRLLSRAAAASRPGYQHGRREGESVKSVGGTVAERQRRRLD